MNDHNLAAIHDHLSLELKRLDLLLHREILRLRSAYQLSLDEFRGLYISDDQVDALIDRAYGHNGPDSTVDQLWNEAEQIRASRKSQTLDDLPWNRLTEEYLLSPFEQDVVLMALAPEIDPKYETLYAYLNNDVTRRWPACDLALRVFSRDRSDSLALREYLLPQSALFRMGILQRVNVGFDRPFSLTGGFTLAPAASHFLLGHEWHDPALSGVVEYVNPNVDWSDVPVAEQTRAALRQSARLLQTCTTGGPAVLVMSGRPGSGREAAARAICTEARRTMLRVDAERLRTNGGFSRDVLKGLAIGGRLRPQALYLHGVDTLFDSTGAASAEVRSLAADLVASHSLVIVSCQPGSPWRSLMPNVPAAVVEFKDPDYFERCVFWRNSLSQSGLKVDPARISDLANRFVLTAGQIQSAVDSAQLDHALSGAQAPQILFQSLSHAARTQSDAGMGDFAVKVATPFDWNDLVLPAPTLNRLKEVASAVENRHIVYAEWGFDEKSAAGKGLKVLFTGAAGTGKTMAAGAIARSLGLDLYKIDLSCVVSKYIGETEKNLEVIFRGAQRSNAILFFDEADALFGKRSEVKDAHDRYSNIELAYLLQRMESFEGAVILASNLSKNIDEAFARRMHYVVEFPIPDEAQRELLWRQMFAPRVPVGRDVDCAFLAAQFQIAGGDIRNVALDAAFLAAADGKVITMKQLIRAMARQMMKQGRLPSPSDFKQYYPLISDDPYASEHENYAATTLSPETRR